MQKRFDVITFEALFTLLEINYVGWAQSHRAHA